MANVGDRNRGTASSTVTLAAPGAGKRWYLLDVSMISDAANIFTVQSPASTNIFDHAIPADMGYEKQWAKPGLDGAENAAMVIDVSAGTHTINYVAVVR